MEITTHSFLESFENFKIIFSIHFQALILPRMSGYYNKNHNYKKKTTSSKTGGVCSNPVFGRKKNTATIPKICTVVLSFALY
jgi:hypothetical protein